MASTDRIEKKVLLRAPRSRVWRALTDSREFSQWFGVDLSGAFKPGARLQAPVTHEGYRHLTWDVTIDRMEPERLLSWRWHPNAVDPGKDYSTEPMTVVTFELEEVEGGTMLTIVESGFNGIPPARREGAYRGNEAGWTAQTESIKRHVEATA